MLECEQYLQLVRVDPLSVHVEIKLDVGDEFFSILLFAFEGRACP